MQKGSSVPTVKSLKRFRNYLSIFVVFLLINLSSAAWVVYKGNTAAWAVVGLLTWILIIIWAIWPSKYDFQRATLNDYSRRIRLMYPNKEDRIKWANDRIRLRLDSAKAEAWLKSQSTNN